MEGVLTDHDAEPEKDLNVGGNESFERKETQNRENVNRYETKTKQSLSERHEKTVPKVSTDINPENLSNINEHFEQNIVKNLDGTYSCKICGKNSGKYLLHISAKRSKHITPRVKL